MKQDQQKPVTVEVLLQLKRTERPAPEFWAQFDRDLRAKQLAAIVTEKPWWQKIPEFARGLQRYYLPIGATAALVVVALGVQHYSFSEKSVPVAPQAVESTVAKAQVAPAPVSTPTMKRTSMVAASAEVSSAVESHSAEIEVPAVSARAKVQIQPDAANLPSAQLIAANIASAEPEMASRVWGDAANFEARPAIAGAMQTTEPLTQIASPSSTRRPRTLTGATLIAANYSTDSSNHVGDRVLRRLPSETRLPDRPIRYDVGGNQLSIKF